jgi:hypothetical protein
LNVVVPESSTRGMVARERKAIITFAMANAEEQIDCDGIFNLSFSHTPDKIMVINLMYCVSFTDFI